MHTYHRRTLLTTTAASMMAYLLYNWGQPWTPAGTLPQGRDGLRARRMAVWWTFRAPSLGRHGHRVCMRKATHKLPLMLPATACYQRNDVERYSRYSRFSPWP